MYNNLANEANFCTTTVVAPLKRAHGGEVLFIASSSFEKRCTHVAQNLTKDYVADVALICDFRGDYELQPSHQRSLENLKAKMQFNVKSIKLCSLKTYNAQGTIPTLSSQLRELADNHRITHIDFDVTTFTKQYILIMLRLIEKEFPKSSVRILYAPASRYGMPGTRKALTKHVRDIVAIPGFDMFRDGSDAPLSLVVFLGFEEERVLNLLDALSPVVCIPVLQLRRNTHFGSLVPFESNGKLLNLIRTRYGEGPRFVDAENPVNSAKFLLETYQEYVKRKGTVLLIAPHGSKMQTVGIYLFNRAVNDSKNVGVVYALPQMYHKRQYSGEPIGYIAEFTWQSESAKVASTPTVALA
ncbi:MAG: hypothetical protein HYX82_01490 [Chloroflexi bacterium]|nr:hypothetical protein [Chloroflexota bacterium]